ncbi:hypothetical protein L3Q82_025072 [Scortum barcoo]|uniref:Uncharacterized protein n=1 Tax=Scortum barcoo TaxID=214431 RepID=A0ACB8WSP5_9TELE|nr:hypothetical protein L3Q82_025072 [Scortum barcoo]
MDSADANTIKTALDTQAYRLKHHDAQLSNIAAPPASPATAAAAPPQPPPVPFSLPVSSAPVCLASPPKFSGESGECRPFLIQCDLHFSMDPNAFASEQARVAFMVSHITEKGGCLGYGRVTSPAREASSALLKIQQGRRRVVDYALEFRTLAADSGWNETSIISAFIDGLTEEERLSGSVGHPKGLRKPSRNSLSHRQSPP